MSMNSVSLNNMKKNRRLLYSQKHVEYFELYNATVERLQEGMFDNYISLISLNVSNNHLNFVDETVLTEKLSSHLLVLNVSNNRLLELLSKNFQHLIMLFELDLSNNVNITKFFQKESFPKSLSNLEKLYLSGCNINSLNDKIFKNLKNLSSLYLYDNPLQSIPRSINQLPKLLLLDMGLTNIEILKFDKNVSNRNLKILNLSYMRNLTAVDDCALCNYPQLEEISFFGSSKLRSIHSNAFGAVSNKKPVKIKNFIIQSCNISFLPEELFDWDAAESLYLNRNPYICNCSMSWIYKRYLNPNSYERWMKSLSEITTSNWGSPMINLSCRYPLKFRGYPIMAISDEEICS